MKVSRLPIIIVLTCIALSFVATLSTYNFYFRRVHGNIPNTNVFGGSHMYRGWPLYWIVESRTWWSLDEYSDSFHFQSMNFLIDFLFWSVVFQLPSATLLLLWGSNEERIEGLGDIK